MVSRTRKIIQASVTAVRGIAQLTARRHIPDLAVSTAVLVMHEMSLALQDERLSPEPSQVETIADAVRSVIAKLDTAGLRGDVSGIAAIRDPVSRAICQQQLASIDIVYLLDAVMLGVEAGLRDLVTVSMERAAQVRIRDGPASAHMFATVNPSTPSSSRPLSNGAGSDAQRSLAPMPAPQAAGTSPIKPDTDDI